ncbi:MAG TPA: ABC transporter ATP-binding protein [Solirubrobacteraceae bacterium]|nr:ABC transporter ATP-binding protein [Solirubrobacteraceae bacterium]
MLRLTGITKRFGALVANDDVTLDVRPGTILGLLGENGAGKTTLMNIVYGLYQPDDGEIEVRGERVTIHSPHDAVRLGIGMVHQHFTLVPDMTVAENIALRPSLRPRRTKLGEVSARVRDVARGFGLEIDPDRRVDQLSVGEQQRVEIAKLLYRGAELLILDEPTASLTPPEWEHLAAVLRSLADEGKSVILITHKLEELLGVADRCTVLRDAAVVGTVDVASTTKSELARMMVGREVSLRIERAPVARERPVLEVRGLRLEDGERVLLDDISFEVAEGEILGIAGVAGNGQDELVETLIGLRRPAAGEIAIQGETCHDLDPLEFAARGCAIIPEDRHRAGLALELSVWENLVLKRIGERPFSGRRIIDRGAAREFSRRLVDEYGVRTPGVDHPVGQLSGGNQQKLVFARELSGDPRLLIASQPTRGLDVGAMEFVYRRLNERKQAGAATLLLSNELNEILELSDRIAVMFRGRILAILDAHAADAETVGLLMAGEEPARRG